MGRQLRDRQPRGRFDPVKIGKIACLAFGEAVLNRVLSSISTKVSGQRSFGTYPVASTVAFLILSEHGWSPRCLSFFNASNVYGYRWVGVQTNQTVREQRLDEF